jgi:hypothetical protein
MKGWPTGQPRLLLTLSVHKARGERRVATIVWKIKAKNQSGTGSGQSKRLFRLGTKAQPVTLHRSTTKGDSPMTRAATVFPTYRLFAVFLATAVLTSALAAQNDIQQGKIKRVDPAKGAVTLTVNDKELEFTVGDSTQVMDPAGKPVKERLNDTRFKPGTAVMFKAATKDGKAFLVGIKLIAELVKVDMSKVKPLTDMGKDDEYKGFKGGLYPDGGNQRPAGHEAAGLALAKQIQRLDAAGKPSADGKIVLLSVGMSNTSQAFNGFMQVARGDRTINPQVVLVNGAQGGMTAVIVQNPEGGRKNPKDGTMIKYWPEVDNQLAKARVTGAQVQAVWIKQADGGPTSGFPAYAKDLQAELVKIVQLIHQRYPNVKLVYLSSRTCAAWAKTPLNPEPYAFESGFSVRWLIEQQIKGDAALNYDPAKGAVKAPWLSWGPYLWTNGSTKRADGFFYEEDDFVPSDRTHPSKMGQLKIGEQLLQFFKTDTTSKSWFSSQW